MASWHVKKKKKMRGWGGGGGGGRKGGCGKYCVPLEKSWLRPCKEHNRDLLLRIKIDVHIPKDKQLVVI